MERGTQRRERERHGETERERECKQKRKKEKISFHRWFFCSLFFFTDLNFLVFVRFFFFRTKED